MPRLAPVIKTVFFAMFMTVLLFGADLGLPDLVSLLGKTGVVAKTHRCLAAFFAIHRNVCAANGGTASAAEVDERANG
jgi:hypothetical protein